MGLTKASQAALFNRRRSIVYEQRDPLPSRLDQMSNTFTHSMLDVDIDISAVLDARIL